MSHVAKVAIEVKDLIALREACKRIGVEFREGQRTYKWYGKWVDDYSDTDAAYLHGIKPEDYGKCDHAIGVPENTKAYEVGVVQKKSGTGYSLVWDFYCEGFGLEAAVGTGARKLRAAYAIEAAKRASTLAGYSVRETTQADGTVVLTVNT